MISVEAFDIYPLYRMFVGAGCFLCAQLRRNVVQYTHEFELLAVVILWLSIPLLSCIGWWGVVALRLGRSVLDCRLITRQATNVIR